VRARDQPEEPTLRHLVLTWGRGSTSEVRANRFSWVPCMPRQAKC
jgi:hypothetical protein